MKKILLVLMMMVSVSFADFPTYYTYNGKTFKYFATTYSNTSGFVDCSTSNIPDPFLFLKSIDNTDNAGNLIQISVGLYTGFTKGEPQDCGSNSYKVGTYLIASYKIVTLEPETCDTLAAKYPSPSGQCVDCMAFTNFSQRASCACDAIGSSWTPQNVMSVDYTTGGYTYQKTNTECDNGTWVAVYYNPVSNTPTDNNNSTPTDNNNTTPPQDTNNTTPTDGNNTTPPTTPSQADIIQALKDIQNGQKDATTALKDIGVDIKSISSELAKHGTTFNDILNKITDGNLKSDKMYQLMDTEFKGQTQYRNMMGKWVDDDMKNAVAELNAVVGVKEAVDRTTNAVNGTTSAVNAQGTAITNKLGEILGAIKDSNGSGTDMTETNDLLEKIKGDTNSTASGVSKLHDDLNTTNDLLGKIKGLFDNNDSFKTPDVNESKFELSDLLPENNWFETNKLKLNFKNYGGGCYCQTAEFRVAGRTFIFPPQEALDVIPFDVISKIFMAFIYVLGLRDFLRN